MDIIHLQSCDVIGPLLPESQSRHMIEDVHCPPTMIFRTLSRSDIANVEYLSKVNDPLEKFHVPCLI